MAKQNSLSAAIASNLDHQDEEQAAQEPERAPLTDKPIRRRKRTQSADPPATKTVAARLPPQFSRQLNLISAEDEIDIQDLVAEALNLLFVQRGKKKIEAR